MGLWQWQVVRTVEFFLFCFQRDGGREGEWFSKACSIFNVNSSMAVAFRLLLLVSLIGHEMTTILGLALPVIS